jgi:hypothetical protein
MMRRKNKGDQVLSDSQTPRRRASDRHGNVSWQSVVLQLGMALIAALPGIMAIVWSHQNSEKIEAVQEDSKHKLRQVDAAVKVNTERIEEAHDESRKKIAVVDTAVKKILVEGMKQ